MFSISCPRCSRVGSLKTAPPIGKKLRCPECGERFEVLIPTVDEFVVVDMANDPPASARRQTKLPLFGWPGVALVCLVAVIAFRAGQNQREPVRTTIRPPQTELMMEPLHEGAKDWSSIRRSLSRSDIATACAILDKKEVVFPDSPLADFYRDQISEKAGRLRLNLCTKQHLA